MGGCCDPRGCDQFFGSRFARRTARRYRRRGLDKVAGRMVGFLERSGVDGATVLELGGGVGAIQIELLERGAARAVNLELSPSYDREAGLLLRERGFEGRVERRLHDLAAAPGAIERADVVVLHRVVCCYPDYERLLRAAAAHAGRLLVFSYPRRNGALRLVVAAQNAAFRIMRSEFRTFAHPPSAMLAVLRSDGLEPAFAHRGAVWQVTGAQRPAA